VAAAEAARSFGFAVALVEQPYRVAGRRSPAPAPRLDAAWTQVVEQLRADALAGLPLVIGGRSSGARVACRTAAAIEAIAVICLAFPLHPPARGRPRPSRLPELDTVAQPTLVVQGASDSFGMPPSAAHRRVVTVAGGHALTSDLDAVAEAVRGWLAEVVIPTLPARRGR
jgi:predicted alpha/beta-hydrolase family hydrolase